MKTMMNDLNLALSNFPLLVNNRKYIKKFFPHLSTLKKYEACLKKCKKKHFGIIGRDKFHYLKLK